MGQGYRYVTVLYYQSNYGISGSRVFSLYPFDFIMDYFLE